MFKAYTCINIKLPIPVSQAVAKGMVAENEKETIAM